MDIRDKIWEWSEGLDDWQNDLLRRIYELGELNEDELDKVKDNLLATISNDKLSHEIIRLQKDQIQTSMSVEEPVKIKKLSDLQNVGSVTEDGVLHFLPEGLTIIYGENGTGKSSYARVLKKACRAIKQDLEIYPNAYEEYSGDGTAKIEILKGTTADTINRNVNDKPDPRLNSISIYDRECAGAYTEGKILEIPYLPADLQSMKRMAEEQKNIHDIINEEISILRNHIEKLQSKLENFPQDDKIYPKISVITSETDVNELEKLKGLDEVELKDLENAEKEFDDSDPSKIQKIINELSSQKIDLEHILNCLNQVDELINKNLDRTFPDMIKEINTLKESQKLLFDKFSDDLPGTGNDAWKKLWNAAKDFSINYAYKGLEYPVLKVEGEQAKCVLCQQTLQEGSVQDRLKRFEKYISDDIEQQLKEKRTQRDSYLRDIDHLTISNVFTEQTRNLIKEHKPEILSSLEGIETNLDKYKKRTWKALKEEQWDKDFPSISISVKNDLTNFISELENQRVSYENLKIPSERENLDKKIKKLRARKELDKYFNIVEGIVSKNRKIKLREEAIDRLNSRPITDKVSSLGSDITTIIKDDLIKNLKALNLAYLPLEVKGRGREGEARSEIILKNQRGLPPKAILSDGETNSVSIAYFLAEASHSDHNGTLIFDDPVTSLDDIRREYVASIIAMLSKGRQVIVFTHDIYFMTKLEIFTKKNNITIEYLYVWNTSRNSGNVDQDLPFRRRSPLNMLKKPEGKLKHYENVKDKINPDKRREIVETYYLSLRLTWEATIEKIFLGGIIKRYDSRVDVGGVARLTLTEEMKNDVSNAWSNSSEYLHFEGDLASKPLPTIEKMQSDYDTLKEFINKYKND